MEDKVNNKNSGDHHNSNANMFVQNSDQEIIRELEKMQKSNKYERDLIEKERMFQEPSEQEIIQELTKSKAHTEEERAILNEIIYRFTEPVKYKIKFYQLAVLMYIDHILSLFMNKYMFFRVKIEEKKVSLKLIQFQRQAAQIKLDILSKENIERTRLLVYKLNLKAEYGFSKFLLFELEAKNCLNHLKKNFVHFSPAAVNASPLQNASGHTRALLRTLHTQRLQTHQHALFVLHQIFVH